MRPMCRRTIMNVRFAAAAGAATVFITASAILAAPQQTTLTPGQMTQARVWIENRGQSEAVPVDLRALNTDSALRVLVVNNDVTHPTTQPVPVRIARPVWEYTVLSVPSGQDLARALNQRGIDGWETT